MSSILVEYLLGLFFHLLTWGRLCVWFGNLHVFLVWVMLVQENSCNNSDHVIYHVANETQKRNTFDQKKEWVQLCCQLGGLIYVYVWMHACMHVLESMYADIHSALQMDGCGIFKKIHVHTYIRTYIHTYVHTHTYIYTQVRRIERVFFFLRGGGG